MDHLRVQTLRASETELAEYFAHRSVLRQDIGRQTFQASGACELNKVPCQQCADALALIGIDYDKGHLGLAGRDYDVASAADDHGTGTLISFRNQRDVI